MSTAEPRAITVKELVDLLLRCPLDLPVSVEGCDCEGDAFGVDLRQKQVLITRTDRNREAEEKDRFR